MIEIFALGNWNIKRKGKSILSSRGYQEKLSNMFKYLLLHQGQRLSPEKIINDLLDNEDYYDPRKTLRTQISRVRYMFEYNDFFTIEFKSGYYILNIVEDALIDFKEFEYLLNKGNILINTDTDKAFGLIEEGLRYYKGELLDLVSEDWIIPLRTRYNRLYVRSIYNYLSVLKKQRKYAGIIEVAEKAIELQPYEELLNAYFMEALIKMEQREYALNHYEYFTTKLYNDLKMKPSEQIKGVYKLIKEGSSTNKDENKEEEKINKRAKSPLLEKEKTQNALLSKKCSCDSRGKCNLQLFNFLYEDKTLTEEMKNKKTNYFVSLQLNKKKDINRGLSDLEDFETLKKIIGRSLRSDDILFQCKTGTILLMLYDISYYEIISVKERLEKVLRSETMDPDLYLKIKLQSI